MGSKHKICQGDTVFVTTGKDKGRRGMVLSIKGDHIVVEGINNVKKHIKPNPTTGATGGVQTRSMPLHISNVALLDALGKPARAGFKIENGQKLRVLKTTGAVLAPVYRRRERN